MDKLIEEYCRARALYEDLKEEATKAQKAKAACEAALIDNMLSTQTKSIKRDDGITLSLRKHASISSTEANREEFVAWLNERDLGDEMCETTPIKKRVLDWIKEEDIEDIPEALNFSERPVLSVLGWRNLVGG